jgi:hypothetical protein
MFDWFRRLFGQETKASDGLRAVPGALVAVSTNDGKVVYNALDPFMQQFMGRCIGAIKKAGMKAKGSGQFSVLLGDSEVELILDEFWLEFSAIKDDAVFVRVVSAAKAVVK